MNGILNRSVEDRLPIIMIYLSSDNQITQRKVQIQKIIGDRILAYCYLRKSKRTFKLENVLSVSPVGQKTLKEII